MRDITTAMAIVESLVDYRRSRSSEDSHNLGGGEEVLVLSGMRKARCLIIEDKGKFKYWESAPRLRCFIYDGLHLARECLKREALNALIRKSENEEEEEARFGSTQMLGAL